MPQQSVHGCSYALTLWFLQLYCKGEMFNKMTVGNINIDCLRRGDPGCLKDHLVSGSGRESPCEDPTIDIPKVKAHNTAAVVPAGECEDDSPTDIRLWPSRQKPRETSACSASRCSCTKAWKCATVAGRLNWNYKTLRTEVWGDN